MPVARADESSGTWTGAVEARGNYYWETSTRVIAPELNLDLESSGGVRVHGHYLVDTITSASQAAGARTDRRFTEVRHDFGTSLGREVSLGDDVHLDLGLGGRYSTEPDYHSVGGNVAATLALNDRATLFSLSSAFTHDEVGKMLKGANDRVGMDGRDLSDRGTQGNLDGIVLTATWDQVLSPVLTLEAGYTFGYAWGYLQNPYRQVVSGPMLVDERHPDERYRHVGFARLAYFFRPSRTAFHVLYRAYVDDWEIGALNPEARVYQHFGDDVMLRLSYRFYTQTRAFFQHPQYDMDDRYLTADPKMEAFHSHRLGGLLLLRLWFLEQSPLDFAWNATIELGLEYIWNTSPSGNGIIGQAGLRIPF